jgi:hypothetical protein
MPPKYLDGWDQVFWFLALWGLIAGLLGLGKRKK